MSIVGSPAAPSRQQPSASLEPLPNLHRSRNLDLIRAAAISMVLIYHGVQMSPVSMSWLTPITSYGQYGVDLFFVLSGWLIGGLYWRERASFGDVLIIHFWVRRWVRTIPPYLAALSISWLAVYYVRNEPFDFSYLIFIQNYYERIPFFLVSWSLCVEEHFYLIIPLAFVFLSRNQRIKMYFLVALAIIAPAGSRLLEYPHSGSGFGYALTATHLRMEGLFLGFSLSYIATFAQQQFRMAQRLSPYILIAASIFMILLGFVGPWLRYTLGGTAVSIFFVSMLLCAVSCKEIGLLHRLIAPIAVSSYSIYLTHALAIQIARVFSLQLSETGSLLYFPIMLTIVGAFSVIFYYGIERTSIIIRDAYWPRRTITTGGRTSYRSKWLTN
jgi:peptidoglycan/LPS O-acetylase OafA/YrhL